MTTYEFVSDNKEQLSIDETFLAIVEQIDAALTPLEIEALESVPTPKPGGFADQGYRHD